jgi:hypothetical protein
MYDLFILQPYAGSQNVLNKIYLFYKRKTLFDTGFPRDYKIPGVSSLSI